MQTNVLNFSTKFLIMNKKLLSFVAVFVIAAATVSIVFLNNKPEPAIPNYEKALYGEWKMVGRWENGVMTPENNRILVFRPNHHFTTYLSNGHKYNDGLYSAPSATDFVTIHMKEDFGQEPSANTYAFTIKNDTLNFKGYYLARTGIDNYERYPINETWVRSKELKYFNETEKMILYSRN